LSPNGDTTSGAAPASPPITMLRSEEQLTISRTVRVKGAVRLHKRIVTETITQTVEVRREELVITEVAAGDVTVQGSLAAHDDTQIGDREFDLILHEERVVISTAVVPVERVRVRVHVVTDQVQIQDTRRREHVDPQKA
jgi:uncharacterized protein (TIGR02271 family)